MDGVACCKNEERSLSRRSSGRRRKRPESRRLGVGQFEHDFSRHRLTAGVSGPDLRPAQRRPRHRRTTPLLRPLRARARTWPPFDWASIHRWPAMIPAALRILRGRSQGIGLAQACCDDAAFGTVAPVSVWRTRWRRFGSARADCGTTRRAALWYTDPECGGTCSHVCGAAWPRQNSLGFAL